jgi:hypothetical protein
VVAGQAVIALITAVAVTVVASRITRPRSVVRLNKGTRASRYLMGGFGLSVIAVARRYVVDFTVAGGASRWAALSIEIRTTV